jgi:hypothetical protein
MIKPATRFGFEMAMALVTACDAPDDTLANEVLRVIEPGEVPVVLLALAQMVNLIGPTRGVNWREDLALEVQQALEARRALEGRLKPRKRPGRRAMMLALAGTVGEGMPVKLLRDMIPALRVSLDAITFAPPVGGFKGASGAP